MSECVLKTLACRGLRVGPSKLKRCVKNLVETAVAPIILAEVSVAPLVFNERGPPQVLCLSLRMIC